MSVIWKLLNAQARHDANTRCQQHEHTRAGGWIGFLHVACVLLSLNTSGWLRTKLRARTLLLMSAMNINHNIAGNTNTNKHTYKNTFVVHCLQLEPGCILVCYKVSLCENFQQHSCNAFTGLSNRAQIVGGGRPLLPEILGQSDPPPSKTVTSNRYSLIAPAKKVQLSLTGSPLWLSNDPKMNSVCCPLAAPPLKQGAKNAKWPFFV